MIDEAELRELLEEAAAYFEVPADGEARVLVAATAPAEPKKPRWRRPRLAIGVASVLVAVGGVFVLGTMVGSDHTTTASKGAAVRSNGVGSAGPAFGTGDQGVTGGASSGAEAGGAGLAPPRGVQAAPALPPAPLAPVDTAKVIKTGSVQIEVKDGAVSATLNRLATMATGLGGYVADSKTAEGGDNPTGSVTLRVPVGTFENLVAGVRGLGTVRSLSSHGQDVTAQYSDIQAKLTALSATRDQLLTILHRATAIGDVLAVQDRINDVQTQIDQLQGQQKLLDDQTSYAALSVDVAQHGAPMPGSPTPQSGLAKAWHDAVHGFAHGVETIIGHSGTALLILLIVVALFFAVRAGWPWLRRRLV
jgi:hypothetical protein